MFRVEGFRIYMSTAVDADQTSGLLQNLSKKGIWVNRDPKTII